MCEFLTLFLSRQSFLAADEPKERWALRINLNRLPCWLSFASIFLIISYKLIVCGNRLRSKFVLFWITQIIIRKFLNKLCNTKSRQRRIIIDPNYYFFFFFSNSKDACIRTSEIASFCHAISIWVATLPQHFMCIFFYFSSARCFIRIGICK